MAEAVVSAVLQKLMVLLLEKGRQEVNLVTGVGKEINKFKSNLESIRTLLDDAEEKQITERGIKLWLDRLKTVCYDMENVLDEWMTALLNTQTGEGGQNSSSRSKGKVCCSLIPCFSFDQVVHRRDIALQIKEINERLDDIAKEKDRYQLASRDINRHTRRVESTAFVEVSKLHGRDEVKKDLVSSLLCGSSDRGESDVKTVSVVGMGGIGKTSLAQLIYDDADVKTHFNERIWVCVSEDFEETKIARAMLQSLDPNSAQNIDSLTLQSLLERIRRSVEGKMVFLVLDDVWTDECRNWEPLRHVLRLGARASRILVTTRKDTVAMAMESIRVFHLEELSDDVCWKILRQDAFVGKGEQQCRVLENTGRKIVEKCKGLPLAAKTLGSMLRFKKSRGEWEKVLNSELWKLDLVQKDVFVPLMLSYYDLPSTIRRCFLYCSVFPKDHLIERDDLVRKWMALGYLGSVGNLELEETGIEYFECLVARSFFQDLEKLEDGDVGAGKLHDIVVDFARFLMGNEFVFTELDSIDNISLEKTRHLVLIREDDKSLPSITLLGAKELQSLTIFDHKYFPGSSQDFCNSCIQPKRLLSLEFTGRGRLISEFPKEVGNLMHLRLLNLSGSYGMELLPDTICDLYNLQSLLLRKCYSLVVLPEKMEKLINLRCLDTSDSYAMKFYPKGIGRLTNLRVLKGIFIMKGYMLFSSFSWVDLENLCHLRSLMLIIDGDAIDPLRANLQKQMHLKDLELVISPYIPRDGAVLALNPPAHTNVRFSHEQRYLERNFLSPTISTHSNFPGPPEPLQ